jgi:hypothetical protein
MLIAAVMILGGSYYLYSDLNPSPKFKVGDCIEFQSNKERWEEPSSIERIEEVGKKKYRTSLFLRSNNWYSISLGIRFTSQKYYKKVDCPNE